jgi:hypothetical protein
MPRAATSVATSTRVRPERALALVLVLVAVDRGCVHLGAQQALHHAVGAVLGAREHHHACQGVLLEQALQERLLQVARHVDDRLLDLRRRARHRRHLHLDGVAQQRLGQVADFLGHRRREEHRLPPRRHHAGDRPDGLDEAHVEHPVGLVQDQHVHLGEAAVPLLDEVEEPPGRRHHHVDAVAQRLDLRVLPHASEDHRHAHLGVAAVGRQALADLHGELARGREDQRVRPAGRAARRSADLVRGDQPLDQGQRERRGLAGAGLGAAEHVATLERGRDRALLDRRRRAVALLGEGLEERGVETECGERHGKRPTIREAHARCRGWIGECGGFVPFHRRDCLDSV